MINTVYKLITLLQNIDFASFYHNVKALIRIIKFIIKFCKVCKWLINKINNKKK